MPRLDNLRADRSRITAFNFDLDEGLVFDSEGVAELDEVCHDVRPRLIVVDPITHFLGDQRDMHRANEVRAVLSSLNALAKRHDCAVLVLAHVNKNEGTKAAYRLLGSVEFRNAVRSLLVAGRLEDEPERGRAIFHDEANAPETGEPIGFDLKRDPADLRGPGIFRWQPTDLTKAEMFEGKAPKVVKRQLAKDILRAVLDDGAIVSSERAKKIAATGGFISEATIRDARRELGVDITKRADGTEDWTLHGG